MAVDEVLLTLSLELASEYDPTLDTSEGSPFRTKFLDPLLDRVGASPLDGDTEDFLKTRLETEIEGIDVSPLSGMRDLAIRAAVVMLEPYRREINAIKLAGSLDNFQQLTKDEINAILANYFTEIQEGNKAVGTARIYFPSPQSVVVTPLTQFSTGGGLNFFPQTAQSLTSTQMSFNQDGSLFYFDVLLQAENPGDQYEIEPNEISNVTGLSGALRVTNLGRFTDGINEETKEEAIARTKNSITIRNLITDRGVKFVLPESFPKVDTIQVIGYGDVEMQRDVITGPVSISDIPGGLTGIEDPDLGSLETVHIGGKTDIYVYQAEPNSDDLDIEDLTDKGYRIYAGYHGFTQPGGPTSTFEDIHGFFTLRGVVSGDLLLLGQDIYAVVTVASVSLTVGSYNGGPSTISEGLFEQTYEVVRKVTGFVTLPLYDLVAEDDDGNPIIDEDDDPIAPIQGDLQRDPLVDGSSVQVKKKDLDLKSIARSNIKLPVLRGTTVELLDPLTLEATGLFIPMRNHLLATALEDFTGGSPSTKAQGTIRVYFRDAVNAWITRATTGFVYQVYGFQPISEEQGSLQGPVSTAGGTISGTTVTLTNGNFTPSGLGLFDQGYRVTILTGPGAGTYTVIGGVWNSGPNETVLTIREELPATFSGVDWKAHVGVAEATIQLDTDLSLYYFDISVEATSNGAAWNLSAGTTFVATALYSEGWALKTTIDDLSFSTKELPYLEISEWVNDDFFIAEPLDAPAIRVSYEYAGDLVDIQEFCESEDNRIVAEDTLVRHFLPSYVRANVFERDLDAVTAKETVVAYINALDPTLALEVSDVAAALYDKGSTHFKLPMSLVGLAQDVGRVWSAKIDQDSLGSNRVQHFVADTTPLTVTQE